MAGKNTSVYAIFDSYEQAEVAVDVLRNSGFRSADISVLFSDVETTKEFAHERNTKAPEGAAVGASTGALIGGVLGWLAGIGAIAIPGVGPFIAAGPIMGALAGTGLGGAAGGVTGALVGLGLPEYEAKRFEGRVSDGGVLMSVHCDDSKWIAKAKVILEECGAQDVASAGEAHVSSDPIKSDKPYIAEMPLR